MNEPTIEAVEALHFDPAKVPPRWRSDGAPPSGIAPADEDIRLYHLRHNEVVHAIAAHLAGELENLLAQRPTTRYVRLWPHKIGVVINLHKRYQNPGQAVTVYLRKMGLRLSRLERHRNKDNETCYYVPIEALREVLGI